MLDVKFRTNKVGLVPYRWRSRPGAEFLQFLVHLPNPKVPGQEEQMKWGVSRGTVKYKNDKDIWEDIHNPLALHQMSPDLIEDHWVAACNEAEEELGIPQEQVLTKTRLDHGLLDYQPEGREPYPVHFYSAQIHENLVLEALKNNAKDSQDLAWKTLNELKHMVTSGASANDRFKEGYIYVLHVITEDLHRLRT